MLIVHVYSLHCNMISIVVSVSTCIMLHRDLFFLVVEIIKIQSLSKFDD